MAEVGGFEWTPFGIRPIGSVSDLEAAPDKVHGASVQVVVPESPAPIVGKTAKMPASHAAVNPKNVVRAAKARVKEIKAELRRMKKLERELAQLEALLQAASKPIHLAPVRALSSRK